MSASDAIGAADLAARVDALRGQLRRREFAAACDAARRLRDQHPADRDVLHLLAVGLRGMDLVAEALEVLQELERHHPRYGRLFEERGLCHLAQRDTDPAIAAFSQAVALNPWLPGSWNALQRLCHGSGRAKEAQEAAECCASLERLPAEIVAAHALFTDGEIRAAELVLRQYFMTHGDHLEGMRLLARISLIQDANFEAQILLENVLRMAPDYHDARFEYAQALYGRMKHLPAREELEKLLAHDPENRAWRLAHAHACARLGDYEQALPAFRRLLSETPADADLHLSVGIALKTLGRTAEAVESYRAAAALRPAAAVACWNLADLKTYRFEDAELDRMIRQEAQAETTPVDRYHLCFALGKALEDRGEYERSFRYYARGNELKKRECGYVPGLFENYARAQAAVCTAEFFAAREGWGCPDAAPIFVVGLPRAGSTLIEQILASHSRVDGTMELPGVLHLLQELHYRTERGERPGYPQVLTSLTREDCTRLGESYIRESRAYRHGRPLFVDKWPSNFRDLGLIHLILPNARVIDARREAMACCFSNYKQLFTRSGPQFVYSFEDIARYYRMYLELMRHWESVVPGKILRVQHEELVTDFPASVQRIFEFCDLEAEPACFEFHRTERAIHSPSAGQVRQPINRDGLDQWRHFEPWLGPLKEALG